MIQKRPLLIVVTGLPGTGKTTFAAALSRALDGHHLSTDQIRHDLGKTGQYDEAAKQAVYQEMRERAQTLLEAGQSVIVDGTFYKHQLRDVYIRLARVCSADLRWIEVRASEETIRQRVSRPRPDSEADFNVYLKIKAIWEPLEETRQVLWTDELSIPELLQRAMEYIALPQ